MKEKGENVEVDGNEGQRRARGEQKGWEGEAAGRVKGREV